MTKYPALEPVVITGVGMVTPVGNEPGEVVSALKAGRCGVVETEVDGRLSVMMGCVADAGEGFAAQDRAFGFALKSVRQALEQSRLSQNFDPTRLMTVIGSSKGRIGNLLGPPGNSGPLNPTDFEKFPGDTLGLEVCRTLGLSGGPVMNCPAACATGIVCLIRGVQALQMGEADAVLAGSAESAGRALLLSAFRNMGALAPQLMRPFNIDRCGFNPGEGGAVFVLERESDAVARGATVLARIVGWDQRSDASHITAADPAGAVVAHAIRQTLKRAGWHPDNVDYINAHGTATPLNDLVEARAILNVFGPSTPPVSSIKPYIGHLLGASSAVELALVMESARAGFLPPTPGLIQPDPDIPLQFVSPVGSHGCFQCILKLSLGFGGHIGVIALEIL